MRSKILFVVLSVMISIPFIFSTALAQTKPVLGVISKADQILGKRAIIFNVQAMNRNRIGAGKIALSDMAARLRVFEKELRVIGIGCAYSANTYTVKVLHLKNFYGKTYINSTTAGVSPMPYGVYTYNIKVVKFNNKDYLKIDRLIYSDGSYDIYIGMKGISPSIIQAIDHYDKTGAHKSRTWLDSSSQKVRSIEYIGADSSIYQRDVYNYEKGRLTSVTRFHNVGGQYEEGIAVFKYTGSAGLERVVRCDLNNGVAIVYLNGLASEVRDRKGSIIMKFSYNFDKFSNILATIITYPNGKWIERKGLADAVDIVIVHIGDIVRKAKEFGERLKNDPLDLDANGIIDERDLLALFQGYGSVIANMELLPDDIIAGFDLNKDGAVDKRDLLMANAIVRSAMEVIAVLNPDGIRLSSWRVSENGDLYCNFTISDSGSIKVRVRNDFGEPEIKRHIVDIATQSRNCVASAMGIDTKDVHINDIQQLYSLVYNNGMLNEDHYELTMRANGFGIVLSAVVYGNGISHPGEDMPPAIGPIELSLVSFADNNSGRDYVLDARSQVFNLLNPEHGDINVKEWNAIGGELVLGMALFKTLHIYEYPVLYDGYIIPVKADLVTGEVKVENGFVEAVNAVKNELSQRLNIDDLNAIHINSILKEVLWDGMQGEYLFGAATPSFVVKMVYAQGQPVVLASIRNKETGLDLLERALQYAGLSYDGGAYLTGWSLEADGSIRFVFRGADNSHVEIVMSIGTGALEEYTADLELRDEAGNVRQQIHQNTIYDDNGNIIKDIFERSAFYENGQVAERYKRAWGSGQLIDSSRSFSADGSLVFENSLDRHFNADGLVIQETIKYFDAQLQASSDVFRTFYENGSQQYENVSKSDPFGRYESKTAWLEDGTVASEYLLDKRYDNGVLKEERTRYANTEEHVEHKEYRMFYENGTVSTLEISENGIDGENGYYSSYEYRTYYPDGSLAMSQIRYDDIGEHSYSNDSYDPNGTLIRSEESETLLYPDGMTKEEKYRFEEGRNITSKARSYYENGQVSEEYEHIESPEQYIDRRRGFLADGSLNIENSVTKRYDISGALEFEEIVFIDAKAHTNVSEIREYQNGVLRDEKIRRIMGQMHNEQNIHNIFYDNGTMSMQEASDRGFTMETGFYESYTSRKFYPDGYIAMDEEGYRDSTRYGHYNASFNLDGTTIRMEESQTHLYATGNIKDERYSFEEGVNRIRRNVTYYENGQVAEECSYTRDEWTETDLSRRMLSDGTVVFEQTARRMYGAGGVLVQESIDSYDMHQEYRSSEFRSFYPNGQLQRDWVVEIKGKEETRRAHILNELGTLTYECIENTSNGLQTYKAERYFSENGELMSENISNSAFYANGTLQHQLIMSAGIDDWGIRYERIDEVFIRDIGTIERRLFSYKYGLEESRSESQYDDSGSLTSEHFMSSVLSSDGNTMLGSFTSDFDYNKEALSSASANISTASGKNLRVEYEIAESGYITRTRVFDEAGNEMEELGGHSYIAPREVLVKFAGDMANNLKAVPEMDTTPAAVEQAKTETKSANNVNDDFAGMMAVHEAKQAEVSSITNSGASLVGSLANDKEKDSVMVALTPLSN